MLQSLTLSQNPQLQLCDRDVQNLAVLNALALQGVVMVKWIKLRVLFGHRRAQKY